MGHQSYVVLCTETTLSNPPVVQPKSSCDVHLLRSPWLNLPELNFDGLRANQSPIPIPVKINRTTAMIRARCFFDNLLQHELSSSFELDGI